MLFLLSPAKSLDYACPVPADVQAQATQPAHTDRAAELIRLLKPLAPREVSALMGLSDALGV